LEVVHIDEIDVALREDEDYKKGYRAFATEVFPFEIDVEGGLVGWEVFETVDEEEYRGGRVDETICHCYWITVRKSARESFHIFSLVKSSSSGGGLEGHNPYSTHSCKRPAAVCSPVGRVQLSQR
jgi:hypothetical protein